MIRALISGVLHNTPERRTARNGNDYALCRLSVPQQDGERIFCSCIVFDRDAVERLLQLKAGANVAIAGMLKVTTWKAKDGTHRPALDLVGDEVASTTPRPKKPKERAAKPLPAEDWLSA